MFCTWNVIQLKFKRFTKNIAIPATHTSMKSEFCQEMKAKQSCGSEVLICIIMNYHVD